MGVACASDNIALDNETSIASSYDNDSVVLGDVLGVKSDAVEENLIEYVGEESVLSDSSKYYEIITSNNTKYDFHDDYKIKIVDDSGRAVFGGHVDFYVNHTLVTTSNVDLLGFSSFNLNSYIKSAGTYDIESVYSTNWDYACAVNHKSIVVDDVPMDERDIQIHFENIKLYDLGEQYRVRVVDKQGNPVRKGNVMFIAYDRIFYSNISESGIASFYLPNDLNITLGHLLVWSMYSDGPFSNLVTYEQITIGTRTTVALDKSSLGSRMMNSWNRYNFTYSEEGMYIAPIKKNVNLVLDLTGKCYLMYENTINTSAQLSNEFSSLASSYKYDVVKLNLVEGTTYTLKNQVWEDQEWYYASRVSNGQLIVNGNGATIKPDEDASDLLNFMYIGREANVNFFNVNINKFNHVFINQGNLLCDRCIFRENLAYKFDVKLSGSGTVVHNYNTVFFDGCGFYDNDAKYMGFGKQHMDASILYAEPYSLNIFNGLYGKFYSDSFYCCNFTTTIFYDVDNSFVMNKLTDSVFDQNSYFATVDRELLIEDNELVLNVRTKSELMSAFYMLNSFINASKVTINLAPGTYEFTTDDVEYHVRAYNYRHMQQDPPGPDYTPIQDKYLLDVGFCPVIINAKGAKIKMTGNDDDDDYHFAYIGKFGSLKIESGTIEGFNTAFFITGNFEAYNTYFLNNVIDYSTVHGDYGGAFRSHGGKITCSYCSFEGNRADNIGDYSTSDFYADMSSTIDLIQCEAEGYMDGNSYLKADWASEEHIDGATYYEKYETWYTTDDFKVFNVSDTNSYNKLKDYFSSHKVKSLYVNFTGDYSFDLHPVFDRGMAIVFNSNGYNVKFNRMKIESPSTMTFIGFDFDNLMVEVKGTATFINCKFHNNKQGEDYFFSNEGSCTLLNCDFYDNEGDDSIIYNKGSLTIYDSSFRNNEFDDDYGVIYNYGGSVSCINTTFSGNTEGKYIFNFASGNCAYSGSSSDVEFDEPWANWKAGLVQGAFLLGTAFATYGAGTAVGAFIPGVAGFVIASVAGAGIGAVSGLTYGLIEGNVYHDYSNVWKHTLTFAFMGLGLAQSGFAAQANFIRQVDEAFNNRPSAADIPGGQRPSAPQNPQGGQGAGGLEALENNPAFQAELKGSIEADIEALINAFGNQYNQFINTIRSALNALPGPNVNVQELLTLYSTMETILARQQVVNPAEVPANIINRVANNPNAVVEPNQLPPAANIIPLEGGINNFLDENAYMLSTIENNPSINYLGNMLSVTSYQLARQNQTHAERVMNLLINVNALYNRASNLGLSRLPENMDNYLRFLNGLVGQRGNARTINALFDFSNPQRVAFYEGIYQRALNDLIKSINASNLAGFDLDGKVNITSQLESRITNLINQLDKKFDKDPNNLDKYNTLKDLYNTTSHNDLDVMLKIYTELSDLAKFPKMDMAEYNRVMSFNHISLIKSNIYYGIFYQPDSVAKITDLLAIRGIFESNMKLLRQINETVYNETLSDLFGGRTLENWQDEVRQLDPEKSVKAYAGKYKEIYDYLNIFYRKESAINQRYIDIFHVKNLFNDFLAIYEGLSNSDKILLNRYFYDQCSELIKSYNGLHYMHGMEDQSQNLKDVMNISDTSRGYFNKLTKLYVILSSSKSVDNLFKRDITGLTSTQIGDMIIEDLFAFYQINYECLKLTHNFYSQQYPQLVTFSLILNWMNHDSINELKNFYNTMASFRNELSAVYTIQKQFYFRQPIDIDYYKKNIVSDVAHRDWLSNDLQFEISTLFGFDAEYDQFTRMKEFVVLTYVDNLQFENMTRNQAEIEKCAIRTYLYIEVYNQYLKNPDLAKSKMNLIEYILEATSQYPLNVIMGDEYSSLINLNFNLSLDNIRQQQQNLNPKYTSFSDIDVVEFTQTLRLLKLASPVTYWMLMDHIGEKYGKPTHNALKWVFNNQEGQFCTKDKNGANVTFYAFVQDLVNTINYYNSKLGVIQGNHIILRGPNYNVTRLVDTINLFNNVFNKKAYYNQMELTDENVKLMIQDMQHDFNYLNAYEHRVYEAIVNELFDGKDFSVVADEYDGQNLLIMYNIIFDVLDEYRDNTKVLENEVNVLINQLNNNTIKNLRNNNLTSTLRSNLLYFIYFWEVAHMNTGESALDAGGPHGEMISLNLLEASLEDIYKRYNEILNKLVFHNVFDDNVDLNKLTLDEMRGLFINNLYRAYHSPQKSVVFETLEGLNKNFAALKVFGDFRAYEDFINTFDNLQDLINWYNAVRNKINVPKEGVKPIPIPKPAVDSTQNSKLNDIKKIIMDENNPDEEEIYSSEKEQLFMGSWKLFVEKYGDISDAVLNDLMKGDLMQYIRDKNRDFGAIRQDIVKFLENYFQQNKQPAEEKDSGISKSQFEDIKKIMENTNLEPEKVYNVINPYTVRLYGSWEKMENMYPDVAKFVSKFLLNNVDLGTYADKFGGSRNNYKNLRQNIIEFIRLNLLREDAPNVVDIVNIEDVSKVDILINGKKVSECSIDEIHTYVLNKIQKTDIDAALKDSLMFKVDSIYLGYLQYVESMSSANIPQKDYLNGLNQYKNRYVEILKELNSKDLNRFGLLFPITEILMDLNLQEDEKINDVSDKYQKFLLSWIKLEKGYPDVAKYILETHFQNDMGKMKEYYESYSSDAKARMQFVDLVRDYLYNNPNSNSNMNNNYIWIEKENVQDASIEKVMDYMQKAVEKANGYVEQIRKEDPNLADSLKNKIDGLHDKYKKEIERFSHKLHYIIFIDELNKLFRNTTIKNNPVKENPQKINYHVQKEKIEVLTPAKVAQVMLNAMDSVKSNVDKINKTNKKLAQWLLDEATKLLSKYRDGITAGDINSYTTFINELNKLFKVSVGVSGSGKVQDEILEIMDAEYIKSLIMMKIDSNSDLKLSTIFSTKLYQPNLNKTDLIVIFKALDTYIIKENNLKYKNKLLTEGSKYFNIKSSDLSDINKVKSAISGHLKIFNRFFPNLHDSISKLFQTDLSRLSELSLDESVNLYNRLKTYTNNYFNAFKNSESLKKEMELRNNLTNEFYFMQIQSLNEIYFNFFDSSNIYFLRNLDNGDAETIKQVILNEIAYMPATNPGLEKYCMKHYFNGKSPANYFNSIKDTIPQGMEDKFFQDLYKKIQDDFNTMRNVYTYVTNFKFDGDKKDNYIKMFEEIYNINLSSDAAKFTRTLILALMNLQVHNQDKVMKILLNGLNKDGSLKEDVKEKIVRKIYDDLIVVDDDINIIDDPDFEMLVEIMNLNFPQSFNVNIMTDYIMLIAGEGGTSKYGTKNLTRYNLILSLILKNKIMFDGKNIVLYPEELDLLNNLSALRCYNIINQILQMKLKAEFSNKNTVAQGLIPGLNNILNSMEYKILNHKKVNKGDSHISPYYTIFNNANNLPNSLQGLINRIENELAQLRQFDSNLHELIRVKYFMGRDLPDLIDEYQNLITYDRLKNGYAEIMKWLNFWRNKDILNEVARV